MAIPDRHRRTDLDFSGWMADQRQTIAEMVRDGTNALTNNDKLSYNDKLSSNDKRTRRLLPAVFAVVILATACASSEDDGDDSAEPSTTTSTTGEPTTTTTAEATTVAAEPGDAAEAATSAQAHVDWIMAVLNNEGQTTEAEVEERFSSAFLAEIPAAQLAAVFPQLFAFAEPPFVIDRFEVMDVETLPADAASPSDILPIEAVLLGADGRRLSVDVAVGVTAPHLIDGLLMVPFEVEFPSPINIDAIDERLAALGPQTSLGLYDVTSGDCLAIHEIRTDTPIVLGSVFKLWVLAALANEIGEGRASWDETMAVTDALRSNPVGEIYPLDTGTEVTLERLAEAMIAISDNTATDMLLDRLGRPTVEAALERSGVADPAANIPLLSTGNLFALKYVADPPNASDYRALDEAERRSLLADLDRTVAPWVLSETPVEDVIASTNADGVSIDQPRDLDIEWFATAEDLCRTLVHLNELAETPGLESVASILEINPGAGLPFDRERWPTIRFKGGSEAGVTAGAWWFEGPDGDRYVLAGGVANPDEAVAALDAVLPIASAIELVE